MEPYLRKAVQNVAKQLYPEFMRPDDDKDEKEREFWIAVYNVPMVHRHDMLLLLDSLSLSLFLEPLMSNSGLIVRVRVARWLGSGSCARTRSDRSSP
jgi:hypothetical protein